MNFWIRDAKAAILSDSSIEAMDIGDLLDRTGLSPTVVLQKPASLVALLAQGELRPRVVFIASRLRHDQAEHCIAQCRLAGSSVVFIEGSEIEGINGNPLILSRPFSSQHLTSALMELGVQ